MSRFICPICKESLDILTHAHAEKHGFTSKQDLIEKCGEPKIISDVSFKRQRTDAADWLKHQNAAIVNSSYNQYQYRRKKGKGVDYI